jgi:hypothetical protein
LEHESVSCVIITPDANDLVGIDEIYQKSMTTVLYPHCTYQDVIWDWTLMQPDSLTLNQKNPQ